MRTLAAGIALWMVGLGAGGGEWTLTASDFAGGDRMEIDGRTLVFFDKDAKLADKARATFAEPAPAGLYRVELELHGPSPARSANVVFDFGMGAGAVFQGALLPMRGGTFTLEAGLAAGRPLQGVTLGLDRLRKQPSVGVLSIRLLPAAAADLPVQALLMDAPCRDGVITPPLDLPPAVYALRLPRASRVRWATAEGTSFETPESRDVHVFGALRRGEWLDGAADGFVALQRYPERGTPPVFDGGVMETVDAKRPWTARLRLEGNGGTPDMPPLPEGKRLALVTSWDDGRHFDHRLTDILKEFGVKGTLFMNAHSEVVRANELKALEAKGFEIGSHSWSHPHLRLCSPERVLAEGVTMRALLERELGHPVVSFAYPYNYHPTYDAEGDYVLRQLRTAGYWGGRATRTARHSVDTLAEPLAWGPDFHFRAGAERVGQRLEEARRQEPGAVVYLWGHSYELAGSGEQRLREALEVLARQPDVWYASQGDLSAWLFLRNRLVIHPEADGFRLALPWIHPYLRRPLELRLPEGTRRAWLNGAELPIHDRRVAIDVGGS